MPLFNRPVEHALTLAEHIETLDKQIGPMQKPLTQEKWIDTPYYEVNIMKRTVKMKQDGAVSTNGLHTVAAVAGEEVEVDSVTAAGLVRDNLAEYVGDEKSFVDRVKDGEVTANELNPDYATGPHRDAVLAEKRTKKQ